ncbi:FAM3A [Cordylochernes scorpioides]|uniref:FAM3A n=1 Tax=Cordylochernes scorpioides TaxID=51811 RepID=A0ABY6KDC7_9ARAC|nr:FAM3A [Cordylochernes scorpioides]
MPPLSSRMPLPGVFFLSLQPLNLPIRKLIDHPPIVSISHQCLSHTTRVLSVPAKIRVESHLRWCGLSQPCPADHFPVHIYTGQDHKDEPRLCLDGKYVLSKNINSGGRGINVAVIDSLTRSLVQVSHFDTYEKGEESAHDGMMLLTCVPQNLPGWRPFC